MFRTLVRTFDNVQQDSFMSFTMGIEVAASLGFEPRQRDPESLVLPLHHEAMSEKIKARIAHCKSRAVAFVLIYETAIFASSRISAPSRPASTSKGFPLFATNARACSTILSIIWSS